MKDKELPWLDWARFIAAFLVLGVHDRDYTFLAYANLPPAQQNVGTGVFFGLTRVGQEAVLLFFVLSGFLVGGRLIERVRNGTFDLASYTIDRATRIWVPLIPAVILSVVAMAPGHPIGTLLSAIGTLVGLQGSVVRNLASNGPFWTLAYEMWFYVLGGAVAAYFYLRGSRRFAFAVVTLAFIVFAALKPHYLFCWVLGALAYQWRPNRQRIVLWVVAILVIGTGIFETEFGSGGVKQIASSMNLSAAHVLFSAGAAILLSLLVTVGSPSNGIAGRVYLVGKPLAAFSYTLYLTHYPVLGVIGELLPARYSISLPSVMLFIGKLVVCMLVATCMYWLFERNTALVRRYCRRLLQSHG